MDNKIMGTGNTEEEQMQIAKMKKNKTKNEKSEDSIVSRVVISKEADDALKVLLAKVRDGFDGGYIERSDLVNWILFNHEKLIGESEIRTIRTAYFDEMLAWNGLTKLANQEGSLSEDLKSQFKSLLNAAAKKNKEGI